MKKWFTLFLLIFYMFPSFAQKNNSEFRAVWVITWEYMNAAKTAEENKANIRLILDNLKAANMNAVLWQVRQGGTVYFNSQYEPWGSYAGGSYPGFDPLQYAIDEAHKRGMELHAWFNCFASGNSIPGATASVHPTWICRDQDGNPMTSNIALSPGMDSVRNYTIKVAMDMLRNYNVDGIHLDYVRWNEYSSSSKSNIIDNPNNMSDINLSEQQIKDLKENQSGRYLYDIQHPYSAGIPDSAASWPEWWRGSVNKFVEALHDSIQSVKPYVRLSAAALGKYNWSDWCGYNTVYQDAALWFNQGWLEQLTPMHYHWDTGAGFYGMLVGDGVPSWSPYIQPGVAAKRLYTVGPGSYILDENNTWNNHPSIVNACRTVSFVDGFQFFSYAEWRDHNYFNTAGTTFFGTKTKIRGFKDVPAPAAPVANIVKIDSLHYSINISNGSSDYQWYVLYQSTSDNLDKDSSKIVDLYFGNQLNYSIPVSFTGTQDYNGKYYYKLSAANRYWKESELSTTITTDNIPSLPPVVTSSNPAYNDSVKFDASITLNFSKTMDSTLTFTSVPAIPQSTLTWSNGYKTVVIKPTAPLICDTIYNLTLNSNVKDINGKSIDGNGDGFGGDSYVLKFRVVPLDDVAPFVEKAHPLENDSTFDIDDVISIQFSELIDPASLSASNVVLKRNADVIASKYILTNVNGKSILTVRTAPQLIPTNTYSLTLSKDIKDLNNNSMSTDYTLNFFTSNMKYSKTLIVDNFNTEAGWTAPTYSGSTIGVDGLNSKFVWSATNFVPGPSTGKAGLLQYKWDYSVSNNFLRDYLSGGSALAVTFDTTYTLQLYVYGDGLGNKFRFALDEGDGTTYPTHEVSQWYTVDWTGWKLIEWKLSDTSSVGSWIGNGKLDNLKYRMDSFQLIPGDNKDTSIGMIYFDNLRAVQRQMVVSVDQNNSQNIPSSYGLSQNYPNPFNPTTIISFSLPVSQKVTLEVFNLLGQKISTLVNSELQAGTYNINFNASNLPSGQYFYRLQAGEYSEVKKMLFLK